jgi:two-component system OmpR family sensor kinase
MRVDGQAERARALGARSLLARILIYGLLLLSLAWAALLVVSRLVLDPAQQRRSLAFSSFVARHLPSEREALTRELDEALRPLGAEATAFDLDGRVIASNVAPPRAFPFELAAEAASRGGAVVDERATLASLRASDGSHAGYVLLVRPPIPIRRSALLFGLMLVLIAGASVPLARSIASPLAALGKAARAFGRGELSARSGVARDDEVGQVARAFDEMAARVEASIRAEKELLANVSHELRTPLARIRVALESASDRPERAALCLPEVAEDLAELERLVDDVLTTARLDTTLTGPWPGLARACVDARDLAEAAARRFGARHPGRSLTLTEPPNELWVEADRALFARVLDNLLENAAKYSDDDAPIELAALEWKEAGAAPELRDSSEARGADEPAGREGARVVLEVRDRGIGLAQGDEARVFEPFFRGDRSRARTTGGVGLGLTLARRIVEAHGGAITLENREGGGAIARVELPVPSDAALAAEGA